jgi:hypothetical protein
MASKDITEWHCDRCGVEVALPTHAKHGWFHVSPPYTARHFPHGWEKERLKVEGDCVQSLWEWWMRPRQPQRQPDPVPQEPENVS